MTKPIIVDCSAALAWLLPDEKTKSADAMLDLVVARGAYVPNLWHLEISNSLLVAQRKKRIDKLTRQAILKTLRDLPIEIESHTADYACARTA